MVGFLQRTNAEDRSFQLSPRQEAIVRLIALGLSDKLIARRLGVSRYTVRTHLDRVFAKLAIHTRTELLAAWLYSGARTRAEHHVGEAERELNGQA
jgi:DNA-binding CsgD family transcriptional regulator